MRRKLRWSAESSPFVSSSLRRVGPEDQHVAHEERMRRLWRVTQDARDRRLHPLDDREQLQAQVGLEPEGIRLDRAAVALLVRRVVIELEQRLDGRQHLVLDRADHLAHSADAPVVDHQLVERVADRLTARQRRETRPDRLAEPRHRAVRAGLRVGGIRLDEEQPPVDLRRGGLPRDRTHRVTEREVVEHAAVDEERLVDRRACELVGAAELGGERVARLRGCDVGQPRRRERAREARRRARGERERPVVRAVEVAGALPVVELEDVLVDDRVDGRRVGDRERPVVAVDVRRGHEQVQRQSGRHQRALCLAVHVAERLVDPLQHPVARERRQERPARDELQDRALAQPEVAQAVLRRVECERLGETDTVDAAG